MFFPEGREILPAIDSIVRFCRAEGIQVVWTRMSHDGMTDGPYPQLFPQHFFPDGTPKLRMGTQDFEVASELSPASGEFMVDKTTYSAFPGTGLHERLRGAGRDTLVLTGMATNVCVDSTAREAFTLGYRVIVLSDATMAGNLEAHNVCLKTLGLAFGWVVTSEEFRRAVQRKS